MRHPLAAARPARLRRRQSGGGRALLAWLARWRGEAECFGRWRRVGGGLRWIARPPQLAAAGLWSDALSAVLERPAPAAASAPRRSRRAVSALGETSRGDRTAPRAAGDRRLPPPAAGPEQAGRALLRRLAGPAAAGSRSSETERLPLSRPRSAPRRQPAPTAAKAEDLAAWRSRLLDRSLAGGQAARVPASDEVRRPPKQSRASPPAWGDSPAQRRAGAPLLRTEPRAPGAWAARLEGPAVASAFLQELTARAVGAPAVPASPWQAAGGALAPPRPERGVPGALAGSSMPADAPEVPAVQNGAASRTAAGAQPRPPHFALSRDADLSDCDGLFHALEAAPAVREDPFLRLAETEHLPPAPLGPFALPEERAPPHALPRESAPEQRHGDGSRPSHETPERPAPPDLATLAEALDRILRDEARRHGVDV